MSEQIAIFLEHSGVFILFIVMTVLIAELNNKFFKKFIQDSSFAIKNDPTNYVFLRHAIRGVIYLVGFGFALYSLPAFKALAGSMLTGAGILALVAGFASQHALSNVMSGFFIVIFKPFRVNDRLIIKDRIMGIVEDITLRHTVLRDFENRRIIIPNTVISDEILINADFIDDNITKWLDIAIDYESDLKLAKGIMRELVENHPLNVDVRTEQQKKEGVPRVPVRVVELTDTGVKLRAWAWAKNSADAFLIQCDVLEGIKLRFDEFGIKIPVQHRIIMEQ